MPSFTLHNTNNDEMRNEIVYNLRTNTGTTIINRGNPTEANPLLLSDFNTIHYYHYTSNNNTHLSDFEISTLMLENAIYEVKFNCSGSNDSNNDMLLTPNHGNYNTSYFYTVFQTSFNLEAEEVIAVKYKNASDSQGFTVDFYDGYAGYDPVGKITIYNHRNCKKIHVEAGDTASSTNGVGYWLNNSTESENYTPNSSAPNYNTNDIWSSIGTLNFTDTSFTNWFIYVSRIG